MPRGQTQEKNFLHLLRGSFFSFISATDEKSRYPVPESQKMKLYSGRRNNFNNPVRGFLASFVVQFIVVAYYRNIRLYISKIILIEKDCKRSGINFTYSVFMNGSER